MRGACAKGRDLSIKHILTALQNKGLVKLADGSLAWVHATDVRASDRV